MGKPKQAAKKVHRADRALSRAAGKHRDAAPVKAIGWLSEVGDQPPLIALSLATLLGGAALREPRVVRTGLRMLAAHALATGIKTLVKRSVDRTRPAKAMDDGGYRLAKGASHDHDLNSFPSGHTAGALAVSSAVARDWPGAAPYAHGAAAVIAAVQLPRATHYASDIAAGAVIGLVAEWASSAALDAAEAAVRRGAARAAAVGGSEGRPGFPPTRAIG